MTLKDIAKQLTTAIQTVPNLVQILRDGLEQATAGSTVEVTQVQESGTKIASVKVDDETTDIYAPAVDTKHYYSSTEHIIGKWLNDEDLYEKTISIGNVEAGSTGKSISHGITNLGIVTEIIGTGYNTAGNGYVSLPVVETDIAYQRTVFVYSTDIRIGGSSNAQALSDVYVTIRYTKNVSD